MRVIVAIAALTLVSGALDPAFAADPPGANPAPVAAAKAQPIYRGSAVTWRNSVSALTADPGAELTYNPTVFTAIEFAPRLVMAEGVSLGLRFDVSHEYTEADGTTYDNEWLASDLALGLRASKIATIPVVELDVGAGLTLLFPTSKASQGDTMMFGVAVSTSLSRTFDVLAGLSLSYGLGLTKRFHESTTSERDSPLIPGCFSEGCENQLTTGGRNVSWRVTNSFGIGLAFTEWLSVGVDFSVFTSFLYDGVDDERVSLTPQEPTNTRHALLYDLHASVVPVDPLTVTVGVGTVNAQQRPDSNDYVPFFNRYSAIYLDLRVDVAKLVAAL